MIERMHLKIMTQIHEQGSLTAAAKALHLTQSAVSHAIKKLEQQLGTQLWIKEGRKLVLTQAGTHLLNQSKRLLPQLNRLDEVLLEYAAGDRGSLRIGMECHPCYKWLLTVVNPFLTQWPTIDVDVKQKFTFGGMAALFQHDIDILVTPDPLIKTGVQFTPVFDYEQVLVLSTSNPLAGKDFIQPQDLAEHTLYIYPVEVERLDIFKDFLMPAKVTPKSCKTIEATEIMLQLIAANRGVATLPLWLAQSFNNDPNYSHLGLTHVRLGRTGIKKHIYLGIRESEEENSIANAFVTLAKKSENNAYGK